jgi:hypothetical protein
MIHKGFENAPFLFPIIGVFSLFYMDFQVSGRELARNAVFDDFVSSDPSLST